jgi:hypothetical protein
MEHQEGTEMNAVPKETRDLIDIVAKHYGLPEANKKIMLDDARSAPVKTAKTYAAIVQSLSRFDGCCPLHSGS